MPWGKLDDSLYDHPKLDGLGRDRLAGVGLWALAISWCNRRLTDGHVTADRVKQLGGSVRLADKLVEAGLFDRVRDGYLVHDFLDFNDSKAMVEHRRELEREKKRQQRTNGTKNSSRGEDGRYESRDVSRGDTDGESPATRPDPTRPVPSDIPPPPAGRGRRSEGTAPRDVGEAPRQLGTAPRQVGTSPRQERQAEKRNAMPSTVAEILRRAAAAGVTDEAV